MLFLIIGIVCSFTILLPQEGDGRRMGIGRGGGGLRLARKWQVKYGTLDDSKPLRKEVPFSSKCDKNPLSGHSRTSFHQKFD